MDNEFQAHNIALKTLRQRCKYLQQRLDAVEDENCKLKLENSKELSIKTARNFQGSCLEKQIILLSQQKSQLSHQLKMITSENQTLWSQLSKLMPEIDSLKLSVPSVDINEENLKFKSPANNFHGDTSGVCDDVNLLGDCSKENLEEISLKLINGILMGKNELENQYSQMIDLQNDNDTLDMKNISYLSTQFDDRTTLNNIKLYIQKLKDFKQALYQQKKELSNVIMNMKNFKNIPSCSNNIGNNDFAPNDKKNSPYDEKINSNKHQSDVLTLCGVNRDRSDEGNICPICSKSFTGVFLDFFKHVSDHFENESEEFVDASGNFDIIP